MYHLTNTINYYNKCINMSQVVRGYNKFVFTHNVITLFYIEFPQYIHLYCAVLSSIQKVGNGELMFLKSCITFTVIQCFLPFAKHQHYYYSTICEAIS